MSTGGGFVIQQSRPAGLLGLRTKTRTTVVVPIGQPPIVCPPDDDDEEHAIQIELLRQIVSLLRDRDNEENDRQMLQLIIEMLKDRPSS